MKTLLIGCVLGLLCGGSYTWAGDNAKNGDGSWLLSKYDLNGDQRITQDEVVSKKLNIFRYLDSDKDGSVSYDEYEAKDIARRSNLLQSRFAKIDGDGDGTVTEQEYSRYLGLFASIDSDGDGILSGTEVRSAEDGDDSSNHCLLWFCFRTQLD